MARVRSLSMLLASVVALASCGGSDEAASTTTEALVPSGTVEITLGEPVEIPESFPDVVPIPAYVQLDAAEAHVGATSTIFEITGWYDGDPLDVALSYETTLTERGFEITSRTENDHSLFFIAETDEWLVSAGFFPDPVRNVGTSVGLTVAPN